MTTETARYVDPTTTKPFGTANYWKESERAERKGHYACPCCGKAVKSNGVDTLYIEVVYIEGVGSACYRAAEGNGTEGRQQDSQGCFAVGATCAKRLRKAGAWVETLEPIV